MKKLVIILLICCLLMFGCQVRFQRISFESDTLDEDLNNHLDASTVVINTVNEDFPTQLPMYEISEREISEEEFTQMLKQLGVSNDYSSFYHLELEGNTISGTLAEFDSPYRGYFDSLNMSDEELEELAWETFKKIPFMEGEYEYLGITVTDTLSDSEGEHITRVGVSFRRCLDDIRILGNDICRLYFDGSGLVQVNITVYDYELVGTMDLISLDNAVDRLISPDDFSIDANSGGTNIAKTLQTEKVKMIWVNQHSNGCEILQPIYYFSGMATLEDGNQVEFSSKVIAIPESYTYEKTD